MDREIADLIRLAPEEVYGPEVAFEDVPVIVAETTLSEALKALGVKSTEEVPF